MTDSAFVNADGEMLLVPQQGRISVTTELGVLDAAPGEIVLLPRGLAFKVAVDRPYGIVKKYNGAPWQATQPCTPFNGIVWHGNLVPFKVDMKDFMTISVDHPDPSIFTVPSSPSDTAGTANCDFVIFPPRWRVAEDSFLPPWYTAT